MTGIVFDIQRFSIHDGPGIRTTVFLKGCPLSCPWCHNPEGQRGRRELSLDGDRCTRCGACATVCEHGAHRIDGAEHRFDPEACRLCGACVEACPSGALELIGGEKSVDEVIAVVERDAPFYLHSKGGMTLSGGEPLAQPDFAEALIDAARDRNFHVCVETSGYCDPARFAAIAAKLDLLYFDIKETDPLRHRAVCGVEIDRIRRNVSIAGEIGVPIVLRCPIVPGVNDRAEHFAMIASLAEKIGAVTEVHVLPYHRFGSDKQRRLAGVTQALFEPPDEATASAWVAAIASGTRKLISRG